ncbi:hypothetical protein ACFE04_003558 [Oxalis oulophora]
MRSYLCSSSSSSSVVLRFNHPLTPIPTTADSLKLLLLGGRRRFPSLCPSNYNYYNYNSRRNTIVNLFARDNNNNKSLTVYASSNSNPSAGDQESENNNTNDTTGGGGGGPPILTIIAGLVVFLLVSWLAGSIIAWLFGLVIK